MSELTAGQWREIEAKSFVAQTGRAIVLGELRNIIKRSRRTSEQNKLLWALYGDALEKGGESLGGWTSQDVHEYMLGEFFGWDKRTAFGRTRLKPKKRSSRLTKTQFSEFVEFVVHRFAEYGVVLELPGDLDGAET
jgi:hypothetical protein